MKLKTLVSVVALLMVIATTASANIYTYSFTLDAAGGLYPKTNPPPSTAIGYGTLTLTDPDIATLNLTYSGLSSDLTQVVAVFTLTPNSSIAEDFNAGDLPPSGQFTDTIITDSYVTVFTYELTQGIVTGTSHVEVRTVNYSEPFSEIGGLINPTPVPEPSTQLWGPYDCIGFDLSNMPKVAANRPLTRPMPCRSVEF